MNRNVRAFSEGAKHALQGYAWPGNIRELENLVQRAVALSEKQVVEVADLFGAIQPSSSRTPASELTAQGISLDKKVKDLEVHYLKKALEMSGGNHTRAAQLLGMSLSSLRYKLQKYGLAK
jgi:DNA-binding NtrC family response regulator